MSKVDFLIKQADEVREFDPNFARNMDLYVQALYNSESLQSYKYINKNKEILIFPFIGFVGKLGIENNWSNTFPTYCRYFMLKYGLHEIPTAERVQGELLDRVFLGRSMLGSLPDKDKQKVQEAIDNMSLLLAIVTAGLGIVQDMVLTLNNNPSTLDTEDNECVQIYKKFFNHQPSMN